MALRTNKEAEYTLSYSSMRGVDLSGQNNDRKRYAYAENMYHDYEGVGGDLIETVPGFRKIASLGGKIHRIYSQKSGTDEFVVVHSGKSLYRFNAKDRDSLGTLTPIGSIKDGESRGFSAGGSLYLLDGEKIIRISADGAVNEVGKEGCEPYVPTTFVNGEEYEQRNLLTDTFKEKFLITSTDTVSYGTYALRFRITDEVNHYCAVVGIDDGFTGAVSIPSYKKIGNISYRVTAIADNAFYENDAIHELKINEGVLTVGKYAFAACSRITTVVLPHSLESIEDGAFLDCSQLASLHVGSGLKRIAESAFNGTEVQRISYPLDKESYQKIENPSAIKDITPLYHTDNRTVTLEIKLGTPASEISDVTVGGRSVSYSAVKDGENISSVVFKRDDSRAAEGTEVVIKGTAAKDGRGFYSNKRYTGSGMDAIFGCRVCECFDGRIFLSGNPDLPNTVFYSGRDDSGINNPLYFGVFNYFEDGVGDFPVVSMLAAADMLAVFKSGDDGGGSIFYHLPKETGEDIIPKIYPVAYLHSGTGALGEAISFYDDPLFLSQSGVLALDKQSINLERSIVCRSHNVNAYLLREDLSRASMAKWQGYLALLAGGCIFLADSRATFTHKSGAKEYEWYYLAQIGTFKDSTRVYRYSTSAPVGYLAYKDPDEVCDELVMSGTDNSGNTVYYCEKSGTRYALYPTEEFSGGVFSPASTLCAVGNDLLFFGTESGDICLFNNDKRGVPPDRIRSDPEFDQKEYDAIYARRIHPDFYSFDDHAIRCALKTAMDDCDIPHLTKSTVKHSLTVKCQNLGSCRIRCEVGTDKGGYSEVTDIVSGECSFFDLDFSAVTLSTDSSVSLPIGEKEKNWVEKQIVLYTDAYRAPFGVYSVTYRFTVKGRIKKS